MIFPFFSRAMFRDDEIALVPSREDVRNTRLGILQVFCPPGGTIRRKLVLSLLPSSH